MILTDSPDKAKLRAAIDRKDLAGAIEEYVRLYDWVSFTNLDRDLGPHFDLEGHLILEIRPNLVVWVGMSESYVAAVQELVKAGRIHRWTCAPLVYLIDGSVPNIPVAKAMPKDGYKRLRWLPIAFRPTPALPQRNQR